MTQKWKCTVCGYVHEGPAPPDLCPLCGAEASQFIPEEEERFNLLRDFYDTLVVHAVAAHFPNGLTPAALLLLALSIALEDGGLERAAFWLLAVVLAVAPVSAFTGVLDWRRHFSGAQAGIFYKKMALAAALVLLAASALTLRLRHPDLMAAGSGYRNLYLVLVGAMLPVVVLLGHYGGKLVFHWRTRKP